MRCGEVDLESGRACKIQADSAHINHVYKDPWTEVSWPNEAFVPPSVPSGPQARLRVRAAMVEMSRKTRRSVDSDNSSG